LAYGLANREAAQTPRSSPVWIGPKNLKKDIALEGVFDTLHPRFQTEGGEI
jgi:hypothetical protein